MENTLENKNPIQVADRLFQAMELLAANGPMGLMEISLQLSLNKSTVHRILNSLIYMGYARQNPEDNRYELSFKIVGLANQMMEKVDIVKLVRPYLRRLMEDTGETVHFVERDNTDAVYIDKVESYANSVQMVSRIGSRIPLYRSGVGKPSQPVSRKKKCCIYGRTARSLPSPPTPSPIMRNSVTVFMTFIHTVMHWITKKTN